MTANQFYQKLFICVFPRSMSILSKNRVAFKLQTFLIAPSRRKTKVDSELSAIARFAVHFELVLFWLMWPQTNLLIHVEKCDFHLNNN